MTRYSVEVNAMYLETYEVEAATEDEARSKVDEVQGELISAIPIKPLDTSDKFRVKLAGENEE